MVAYTRVGLVVTAPEAKRLAFNFHQAPFFVVLSCFFGEGCGFQIRNKVYLRRDKKHGSLFLSRCDAAREDLWEQRGEIQLAVDQHGCLSVPRPGARVRHPQSGRRGAGCAAQEEGLRLCAAARRYASGVNDSRSIPNRE